MEVKAGLGGQRQGGSTRLCLFRLLVLSLSLSLSLSIMLPLSLSHTQTLSHSLALAGLGGQRRGGSTRLSRTGTTRVTRSTRYAP